MNSIISKVNTLRKAVATATVTVSSEHTIAAIREKRVPKGDVFEFSRAAGLLAIKKTSDMIPDCHPLPVEYASITFRIEGLSVVIEAEVHTIYKTGVEVEAMHGASLTALTIYDMLKPLDKQVEISAIRLIRKSGGKSGTVTAAPAFRCAVIVCSDSVAAGTATDGSGKQVIARLEKLDIPVADYRVIPDDRNLIEKTALDLKAGGCRVAVFIGGTGASPRDNTPEALLPLLTKILPGVMEHARNYGQQRTPFAMFSRGVAGFFDEMLVLAIPGSVQGALETVDALFPHVLHLLEVSTGKRHDS